MRDGRKEEGEEEEREERKVYIGHWTLDVNVDVDIDIDTHKVDSRQ